MTTTSAPEPPPRNWWKRTAPVDQAFLLGVAAGIAFAVILGVIL